MLTEKLENCKMMELTKYPMEKPNYMLMSLQRIFLLSLIIFSVLVIVYYTPMPEEYFENCDRPCNELDWPMICRVKLVVEVYKTLSKSCGDCIDKKSGSCSSTCILADGRERGVLSANRMLPAPTIHVCHNDILVVDVVHRAPAHTLAVHWRGQPQKETPFMDGAPMLTQCPQSAYTTFQYKFRASEVGTHMYHAHSAADAADGLAGIFVVRQAPRVDSLSKFYNVDATEHTIFIAEWGHSMGPLIGMAFNPPVAESLLINGKGRTEETVDAQMSKFKVKFGNRYRFRVAYGGGAKSCSVKFSIDKHVLRLLALDGHIVEDVLVSSIELNKGERVDFVLDANAVSGEYKIKVEADKLCQDNLKGEAFLVYESNSKVSENKQNELNNVELDFTTAYSEKCRLDRVLCLEDVYSNVKLPQDLAGDVDKTIYVPFKYSTRQISSKRIESWGETDGHRFTYPESPLLTQSADVPTSSMCSEDDSTDEDAASMECVHVINVPMGSTVELVMFDQGGESDHIFHLHGYSFYVVAVKEFNASIDKETITKLNQEGKLFPDKNLNNPVKKDTIVIPKYGAVALRFKADNPGFWMMRDERSAHWTRGLDFVLKVGDEKDFVQAPPDFPRCGSYVGPEYFLI